MGVGWRRILFASDFSRTALAASDEVAAVAEQLHCEVLVTNVQTSHWKTWVSAQLENRHRADRLGMLVDRFRSRKVPARYELATTGEVAGVLVGLAAFEKVDLIVVGASEKSVQRLRRSTAEQLVRLAKQPIWVSKPGRIPPQHIVCGVDGSSSSLEALRLSSRLGQVLGARVSAVHAIGNPTFNPLGLSRWEVDERTEAHRREMEGEMARFVDQAQVVDVDLRFLWGEPSSVLCSFAEEAQGDLIVVGRTGKNRLRRVMLGSTAEQLLRHPCCSLLLLGEGADPLFERFDTPFEMPEERPSAQYGI